MGAPSNEPLTQGQSALGGRLCVIASLCWGHVDREAARAKDFMDWLIRGNDRGAEDVEVPRIFKPPFLGVKDASRFGSFLKAVQQNIL